jgi:hypothetical protein
MPQVQYSPAEIARIGEEKYHREIRDKVLPQHRGKFLTLDILSGDYEIDQDDLSGEKRLRTRHPDGVFYGVRIGYTSAYAVGGALEEEKG